MFIKKQSYIVCPLLYAGHYTLLIWDSINSLIYYFDSLKNLKPETNVDRFKMFFLKKAAIIYINKLNRANPSTYQRLKLFLDDYQFVDINYIGQKDAVSCGPLIVDYLFRFLSSVDDNSGIVNANHGFSGKKPFKWHDPSNEKDMIDVRNKYLQPSSSTSSSAATSEH